jgi:hypothetical protein
MSKMTDWSKITFPIVKNVQAKLAAADIEGIPTEDMPRRMGEMFANVQKIAIETMEKEISEIEGVEGKEERLEYLKDLLKKWRNE